MHELDYGSDWEYASSRIRDTVIRDKSGNPIYVYSVGPSGIEGDNYLCPTKSVALPWDKLDYSPAPLGYVNQGRKTFYAGRIPTRHYKQGLNSTNFRSFSLDGGYTQYNSPHTFACIKGLYPKLPEAVESVLTHEVFSCGFSRHFALRHEGNDLIIFHREVLVGKASWNMEACELNYVLDTNYKYLEELLQEELGHV